MGTGRAINRLSMRQVGPCCICSPISTKTIIARPTTGRRSTSTDERVTDFTVALVTALANRPGPLTFNASVTPEAPAASSAPSPGYGAYLGTVPDMMDSPGGVRLAGVRAGSPAEKAGLRGDDIITRIGSAEISSLQAMTDALRSHQPGDTVDIVVRRGEQTTTVRATLGTRGG